MEVPTQWGHERRGWHVNKAINASDLIAVIGLAIPLLIWGNKVETRFTQFAEALKTVQEQRKDDREENRRRLDDLQLQIRAMDVRTNDKLDQLLRSKP